MPRTAAEFKAKYGKVDPVARLASFLAQLPADEWMDEKELVKRTGMSSMDIALCRPCFAMHVLCVSVTTSSRPSHHKKNIWCARASLAKQLKEIL